MGYGLQAFGERGINWGFLLYCIFKIKSYKRPSAKKERQGINILTDKRNFASALLGFRYWYAVWRHAFIPTRVM